MKNVFTTYIILFAAELILAGICAPHSCEWGNAIFFYYGIAVAVICLLLPFFRQSLTPGKRIAVGFLSLLISVIVWCACYMLFPFQFMCRMF